MQRHGNGEVTTADGRDPNPRSIYLQVLRLNPLTMLEIFDQPEMKTNCNQRLQSTVATQSLAFLNSSTLDRAAKAFANRVREESSNDVIGRAVQLAFCRPPTVAERNLMNEFLIVQARRHLAETNEKQNKVDIAAADRLALADLCQMLLSANEFMYID